jgi:hypothetical protein
MIEFKVGPNAPAGCALIVFLIWLTVVIGIIYVAIHFIAKFW